MSESVLLNIMKGIRNIRQELELKAHQVRDPRYLNSRGRPKKSPSVCWPRDYSCKACSKTFTQKQTLNTHKCYHCPVLGKEKLPKDGKCDKCGKEKTKASLYRHQENRVCERAEKKEANKLSCYFYCEKCGRHFKTSLQLEQHSCWSN